MGEGSGSEYTICKYLIPNTNHSEVQRQEIEAFSVADISKGDSAQLSSE